MSLLYGFLIILACHTIGTGISFLRHDDDAFRYTAFALAAAIGALSAVIW